MVYIIKRNDTLFKIAQAMTGNGSRYKEILPLNPQITNPDFIREGDLLNLPQSWGGGSSNVPATVTPGAPAAQEATKGLNNTVMLIAVIAAGAAGAYWFLGRKSAPAAATNPEEDEDEDEE